MKKPLLSAAIFFIVSLPVLAQVAINSDGSRPDSSAMLDVNSTSKGFLPPRMSQADMEGIANPAKGLFVYNTDKNTLCYFNGTDWDCMDATSLFERTFLCGNDFNDFRDSTIYKTIRIGRQCWMAENLNIGKMINGSSNQTDNDTIEKYCYDDDVSNCEIYGGLYQWDELMEYDTAEGSQGICPPGWHIATDVEWCILENYIDSGTVPCSDTGWRGTDAGGNLKESGTAHWLSPNTGATNSSGFTLLPSGHRELASTFNNIMFNTHIWLSNESGSDGFRRFFSFNYPQVHRGYDNKAYGFSVRCIKDYVLGSYSIGTGGSCDNTIVNGDYHGGIPLDTSNTVTLEVTVTTPGAWSITTNTVNGYSFSGSGMFSTTGTVLVCLYGAGTPIESQTDTLTATVSGSDSTCTFEVTVINIAYNPVTNKTWMDRNLGASQVATSSGDAAAFGDLYQWGRYMEGHEDRSSGTTTTIATTAEPDQGNAWDGLFIIDSPWPFNWMTYMDNSLWRVATGINNPCPEGFRVPTKDEWEVERLSWSSNDAAGAFGSPLKLPAGGYRNTSGSILGGGGFYWSSTPTTQDADIMGFTINSAGWSAEYRGVGHSVRCIKDYLAASYTLGFQSPCANATVNGSYIVGVALDSSNTVTFDVTVTTPGDWCIYANFNNGYGFYGCGVFTTAGTEQVVLIGTGTPINCQTDTFYPRPTDTTNNNCSFDVTVVDTTYNPTTCKTWMDRNLGASQVATSSTDAAAYGDLYQWGRYTEDHEDRASGTTATNATTAVPNDGNSWDGLFITEDTSPYDWLTPQDNTLWQGANGTNNPCPAGFRLPTEDEWVAERLSWSSNDPAGAFGSPLKLPLGGYRNYTDGVLTSVGTGADYWSSTVSGTDIRILYFYSSVADMTSHPRAYGFSVRCIQDYAVSSYTIGSGGSCDSTTVNGGYIVGTALDSSNTVTVDAVVTTPGHWNISTNTLNGYSFSACGIFDTTGTVQVTLYGAGTPISVQTDTFTATASGSGGTCTFDVTAVATAYNPTTGETWMDRNLGASQVATSKTDAAAYGDLYQWGRYTDGHEVRTSGTTSTNATTAVPNDGNSWDGLFITEDSSPGDWLTPQDNTLWQGAGGYNNPCPSGFRLPTEAEWEAERLSWATNDENGAFGSPLKLTVGGYRIQTSGALDGVGSLGYYWSSTVSSTVSRDLRISGTSGMESHVRSFGHSVRCIKD